MKVIALGTSGTYARYGRACSGYLIENDPTFVQVDLGTGVLANMFRHLDPFALTAIVLSHLHADHSLDIYPLRYYLQYNESEGKHPIPLYVPPGGRDALERCKPENREDPFLDGVFVISEVDEGVELAPGTLRFRFLRTNHVVPTLALVCEAEGKRVGYTADTSKDERLASFFAGCDVLICEAAYQGREGIGGLHLTAYEAGELGAAAGVGRLYITHIWPELDPSRSVAEASDAFGGPVEVLREHDIIEV